MKSKYAWNDENLSDEERKEKRKARVLELSTHPFNYSRKRIVHETGLSTTLVYNIRKELVKEGKLAVDEETGFIKKSIPDQAVQVYNDLASSEFGQIASVKKMLEFLKKTNKNYATVVGYFYKVCKTLDKHPDNFKSSEEEVNRLKDQFIEKFEKGESFYIDKNNTRKFLNKEDTSTIPYLNSIRAFRRGNNIMMSEGFLKPEQKQKTGRYRRIKLTDTERNLGIKFMRNISDLMATLFILNSEIGVRIDTLLNLRPKFSRQVITIDGIQCEFYVGDVFEQKQEDGGSGGIFTKVILTPDGRDIIKSLPHGKRIIEGKISWKEKQEYNDHLREFYYSIGRVEKEPDGSFKKYKKGTEEYFYLERPSHAIRHSTIHWWMRITKNDIPTISSMFWEEGSKVMMEYYAKVDVVEALMGEGRCNYCTPELCPDPNVLSFCRFMHALAFYNSGLTQKEVLARKFTETKVELGEGNTFMVPVSNHQ